MGGLPPPKTVEHLALDHSSDEPDIYCLALYTFATLIDGVDQHVLEAYVFDAFELRGRQGTALLETDAHSRIERDVVEPERRLSVSWSSPEIVTVELEDPVH